MKYGVFLPALLVSITMLFAACDTAPVESAESEVATPAPDADLPADFKAVLDAHGGLSDWKKFRQLSYEMPKGDDASEYQLVDLYDRREYIRQPGRDGGEDVEIGFDGSDLWITADTSYQGNPAFYKNLMFYFYAMPWVLADPGINYTAAEPLTFGGNDYPGILVSYGDGVGFSPKDNYRLHFDPATKKMRWLGYTVTGRSGKSSDKFSWIEYPTWTDRGGVELPDSLVWYTVEDNVPVAPRRAGQFKEVMLKKAAAADARFAVPAGARVVK